MPLFYFYLAIAAASKQHFKRYQYGFLYSHEFCNHPKCPLGIKTQLVESIIYSGQNTLGTEVIQVEF